MGIQRVTMVRPWKAATMRSIGSMIVGKAGEPYGDVGDAKIVWGSMTISHVWLIVTPDDARCHAER